MKRLLLLGCVPLLMASGAPAQEREAPPSTDVRFLSVKPSASPEAVRNLEAQGAVLAPADRTRLFEALREEIAAGRIDPGTPLSKLDPSLSPSGLPRVRTLDRVASPERLDPSAIQEVMSLLPPDSRSRLLARETLLEVVKGPPVPLSLPPEVRGISLSTDLIASWQHRSQTVDPAKALAGLGIPIDPAEGASFLACSEKEVKLRAAARRREAEDTDFAFAAHEKALQDFVGACTVPVSAALAQEPLVRGITGILRVEGKAPHCAGVLVAPDEVITARHCLNDWRGAPIETTELRFTPALEPARLIAVTSVAIPDGIEDGEAAQPENDAVLLRLDGKVGSAVSLCFDAPTGADVLAIATAWPPDALAGWPEDLRLPLGTSCRAAKVEGACFAHTCSALPGHSGSAIVVLEKGSCAGLRIVGLHLSGSSPDGTRCGGASLNSAITGTRLGALFPRPEAALNITEVTK